jgi:tRNA pseudouridine55 synthase
MWEMDGVVILDKPAGISSHDAVQRLRKLCGIKRIGHLGTLDPLGTGVLPLVVGRATRLSQFFLEHDRTYEATIRFGFSTDTYDSDGKPSSEPREITLSREQLEQAFLEFRGKILQTPPPVSAKKIDGVPAYKLARMNKEVQLEPVEIEVFDFVLLGLEGPRARVKVRCSSGTYMRSLAHDLGERLGVGAHVESLRRTTMGEFSIDMARTFEQLEQLKQEGRLEEAFIPPADLLPEIPAQRVDATTAAKIAHGRDFRVSPFGTPVAARHVKAIDPQGRLVAIGEARLPLLFHPIVVL